MPRQAKARLEVSILSVSSQLGYGDGVSGSEVREGLGRCIMDRGLGSCGIPDSLGNGVVRIRSQEYVLRGRRDT